MTIDCNAPNHKTRYGIFPAPVTCGAIDLAGSFITVRRVRVINACVQASAECFPIILGPITYPYIGSFDPSGTFNLIEDCSVEQPGENNTHETSCITNVGDYYGSGRSPIIRHCFVNCGYGHGSSEHVAVSSYMRVGPNTFTIKTKRPHNRVVGHNLLLNNVRQNSRDGAPYLFFLKSWEITGTTADEISCYSPTTLPDPSGTPPDPTPFFDDAYIGVDFHGPTVIGCTGGVCHSNAVHDCTYGFYIDTGSIRDASVRDSYFSNVLYGMYVDFNPGISVPDNPAPGGMELPRQAKTGFNLGTLIRDPSDVTTAIATSGFPHGLSTGDEIRITGALINGAPPMFDETFNRNRISITYIDPYRFSYQMDRDPMAGAADPPGVVPIRIAVYCLKRDPANPRVAALDTGQPHKLKVGDVVRITGAIVNGDPVAFGISYNDFASVSEVLSSTKFQYAMTSDPVFDADPADLILPVRFQSRYQIHQLNLERNICNLYPLDATSVATGRGITTIGYQYRQLFTFPNSVLRENTIGHLDGQSGMFLPVSSILASGSLGFRGGGFDATMFDYNLLNVSDLHPVHFALCRNFKGSLNRTLEGIRVPIFDDFHDVRGMETFEEQDSLESKIEDAMLLAML